MLHPSYTDLMKVVNKDVEEGETKVVNSRYSRYGNSKKSQRDHRWFYAVSRYKAGREATFYRN